MRKFRKCSIFLLLWGWVLAAAQSSSLLEPYSVVFDFESGSVGAWSSYPPAQDTAYDPTIWVKIVEGNPTKSLVREVTPYFDAKCTVGFRKKLNMFVDRKSTLTCRYYAKSLAAGNAVLVKLALDGERAEEARIPVQHGLHWEALEFSFSEILKDEKTHSLEAVAVMLDCPEPDSEVLLRFAIDDLKITGYREKKIAFLEPRAHWLEEMGIYVASRHFAAGKPLAVSGEVPFEAAKLEASLEPGLTDAPPVKFPVKTTAKNAWKVMIPGNQLGAGIWHLKITARAISGETLSGALAFLARPEKAPQSHPWLLASVPHLEKIRERTKSGHLQAVWNALKAQAEDYRKKFDFRDFNYNLDAYDEKYWLPTYEGYVRALHTPSRYIRENAIVYAVSGDREAGQAARQALLKMADWPTFVHSHILNQGQFTYWPVGLFLIDLAIGYDFVYDLLAPEERQKIAQALYHKGITEIFKEYVRDNRVSSNTSNWISHVTGGGILCALAVRSEISDEELEPYLTGMILKLGRFIESTFDPAGYYGEGYYYHNFAMQSLTQTMPALDRNFGVAFPRTILQSYLYIIYQQNAATGKIYEFGDAHDDLIPSSMSNFAYIIGRHKDPLLRWLYGLRPGNTYQDLLFLDESVPSQTADSLPRAIRLSDAGSVIFRSGFGPEDFVFVFKCGPFFNHQHFDQGSFFLADWGELFIDEAGNSNYYEDPWYPRLYIQAGGHNCLLADGEVSSQMPGDFLHDIKAWQNYARITDFLNFGGGAFLSGDLTPVYKGKFSSLRRSLLYIEPRTLLLIDGARSKGDVKTLSLRFHAPRKEDIQVKGNIAQVERGGKSLFIRTSYPEKYRQEVLKRPMSLNEFKAENAMTMRARGFLELTADLKEGKAGFVHVLSTDRSLMEKVEEKISGDTVDLKIDERNYSISLKEGALRQAQSYETDALLFSESQEGFLAGRTQRVLKERRDVLSADKPISLQLAIDDKEIMLLYSALQETAIRISASRKPKGVLLNGKSFSEWKWIDRAVSLRISRGEGRLLFNY